MDGASSSTGSGAGILLKGPYEFKVCYSMCFRFLASNNMAEYETFLNRMKIALEVGATDLRINNNSQLVVNQIKGVYQAKDPIMQEYLTKVRVLEAKLGEQGIIVEYRRIPQQTVCRRA